jgi:dolichol-phosphate mannosyltransferase
MLSIVTPAYNESENLPLLYQRLQPVLSSLSIEWEWIVVDDHSRDHTFEVITQIAAQDSRVRGLRFARNFGSHTAIVCGLENAKGDCAVVMAADLQDPPETIQPLMQKWKSGAQVVWAVRAHREEEAASTVGFAKLYYFIMREMVGMKEMPSTGADFFLIDRHVIDVLSQFKETNASILAFITWLGFRQESILYDKQARQHGRSGWNLEKKLKLTIDSIASFTYLPIRLMSYMGFVIALLGFVYTLIVIVNALIGKPTEGWSSLMVVVLVIGGMQMVMMGVLGEYVWRALDESRRRPRYWIESMTPQKDRQ